MSKSMKTTGVARGMSGSCIALLLLTYCALETQSLSAQKQGRNIRNIVLVHGAWADGSVWKGVYDILVKDGYNVSIGRDGFRALSRRGSRFGSWLGTLP